MRQCSATVIKFVPGKDWRTKQPVRCEQITLNLSVEDCEFLREQLDTLIHVLNVRMEWPNNDTEYCQTSNVLKRVISYRDTLDAFIKVSKVTK